LRKETARRPDIPPHGVNAATRRTVSTGRRPPAAWALLEEVDGPGSMADRESESLLPPDGLRWLCGHWKTLMAAAWSTTPGESAGSGREMKPTAAGKMHAAAARDPDRPRRGRGRATPPRGPSTLPRLPQLPQATSLDLTTSNTNHSFRKQQMEGGNGMAKRIDGW
jgi:hypothetical protein